MLTGPWLRRWKFIISIHYAAQATASANSWAHHFGWSSRCRFALLQNSQLVSALDFLENRSLWQLVPQSIGPHSKITFKLFPLNQTWKWHLKTVFLCRDPLERIHCRFLENLDNHSRPLPPCTSPLCRWGPTGHSLSYSICHFYHFHIFCQPTISDTTRISLKVDFLIWVLFDDI